MEKKRSVGVMVIGIIMLVYSGQCLIIWREDLKCLFNPLGWIMAFILSHHILDGFIYMVAGVFIFMQRNWARKFAIVSSIILFLAYLPTAIKALIIPAAFDPSNFFYIQPEIFGVSAYSSASFFSIALAVGMTYIPLILYCFFIFYLTRPNVKEQFK